MAASGKRKAAAERRKQQEQEKRKADKRHSTRSYKEKQEVQELERTLAAGAPQPGSNPLAVDAPLVPGAYAGARTFEELPLSLYTKEALKQSQYITLTAIQRAALPHALCGRDVLGAAKTGSGKTLAFLIPVVEKLYRLQWTRLDGLGALVLTPTRELALQIFEELKKVGKRHEMSAGLLIGGKNLKDEVQHVNNMNILIATPGRLLQHMDETPGFDASNLQVLVLDEADRILDMGFAATLDAIVSNLPEQRQTMLFSATQTKSVRDLARLSLHAPEYLSVHAEADAPTPLKLQQAAMVVELHDKMDVLWSFIKAHVKSKMIVFLSTCKQVRFVFEAFRKLRPGVPLRCLHGNMKQPKRLATFYEFCKADAMVMVATDIAARGLDFPTIDWVVQADCPEDVAAYIHRVGRTARYTNAGRALMLLAPSEKEGMLSQLAHAKVPIKLLKQNPSKLQPVGPALQALLSKNTELKDFAQRALVAYLRSVYLQPNKAVFDVSALPVAEYAQSLGLLAPPKLRFLKRVGKKVVADMELGGFDEEEDEEQQHEQQHGQQNVGLDEDEQDEHYAQLARAAGAKRAREEQEEGEQGEDASEDSGPSEGQGDTDTAAAARAERVRSGSHASTRASNGTVAASNGTVAASNGTVADAADEDGFLVVKRHNVFEASDSAAADAADGGAARAAATDGAAEGMAAAAPKKRKRQKIKAGAVSASRVVFDESGNALDPLEALALTKQLRPDDEEAGGRAHGHSMHVVADAPDERFRAAAQALRARDKLDKQRAAELRRELRAAKKARRKAREQEQAQGAGVQIGGNSSDEDVSNDTGPTPRGLATSDDEDAVPSKRVKADTAYVGMALKQQPHRSGALNTAEHQHSLKRNGTNTLSLAEQEALALQLLRRR